MIAGTTDRRRRATCEVCGETTWQRENFTATGTRWWEPLRHIAPCGRPCLGGGVRPLREEERPVDAGGLDHAHRASACGAPGCGGGRSAQ